MAVMLAGSPGRRLLLAVLASAASAVSDAFLRPPPGAVLPVRRTAEARARPQLQRVWCSTRLAGERPGDDGTPAPSQQSKLARARQLLEDSRLAFEESRNARAKAGSLGREWGLKTDADAPSSGDLQAEFRLQAQWTRAGRALYGTWVSVFGGGADTVFASDPLGLQQSGSAEPRRVEDQIRAAFERLDLDRSGTIEYAELEAIIREMTGATPDEEVVRRLMSEVRVRGRVWNAGMHAFWRRMRMFLGIGVWSCRKADLMVLYTHAVHLAGNLEEARGARPGGDISRRLFGADARSA